MGGEDWEGMLELLRIVAFTPTANMTGQPADLAPPGLDPTASRCRCSSSGAPRTRATILGVAAELEECTVAPAPPARQLTVRDTPVAYRDHKTERVNER